MELEPVYLLRVLTSAQSLPVLNEHINTTFLDEKLEVQRCITLSHCCIVQHCLALSVPFGQVQFVTFFASRTLGLL